MSIYIKGMEMPKDCPMCPMSYWNAGGSFMGCNVVNGKKYAMDDEGYRNSSTRPSWCPIIPVPDHGRLIDADALLNHEVETWTDHRAGKIYLQPIEFARRIKCAPTIIPADAEKEETE